MQLNESLVSLWRDGEQVGYRKVRAGMPVYSRDLYSWSGRAIESDSELPWTGSIDLDARPVFVGDPVMWAKGRWTVEAHDGYGIVLRRGGEHRSVPKADRVPLRHVERRR